MGLQRTPLVGAGTPCVVKAGRRKSCARAPNIGCPKRRKIHISLIRWWNLLSFGTDVALPVSKPVTAIIWTSSPLMLLKWTAGQKCSLYRKPARLKKNVCYTHLLPLKTMPHCRCVKSQCFQTFLIKMHNCKGRLYACIWKMCVTPIGYRRLRAFQIQVILMDKYHNFHPLLLPGVFFFHSTGEENSFCSYQWPQFPVNILLMLTLWRGIWKRRGPNLVCIQTQGNLSLCHCLHQFKML